MKNSIKIVHSTMHVLERYLCLRKVIAVVYVYIITTINIYGYYYYVYVPVYIVRQRHIC